MTFHLEHITSVSPDLPAPSYETVPCPRLRNGKPCNEPLHFETDGLGRLVELCPVCDWGWRPSRQYDAFQKRASAIVRLADTLSTPAVDRGYPPRVCHYPACEATYTPNNSRQRYCTTKCKEADKRETFAAMRAARQQEYAQHHKQLRGAA